MIADPRIETFPETRLVGMKITMSLVNNRTAELFQGFMPRRNEIKHAAGSGIFCMQVYEPSFNFGDFTLQTVHEKWAALEVSSLDDIPAGMEAYTIHGGLYAVFHYTGAAKDFADTFRYIFYEWFPRSEYEVDRREHFEILGDKYRNNQPSSEEDIWIPVKRKHI